ncbi:INO80 complex subunit D-like isoform X1 [Dioscorea cayenensis subsp. rotundata]|uniref:KAT8 regulatory NSL complex subunit 2 n=1 Tax=Dioscorea cayennensis subsp. rotundata TaxID=55577 RepID=A0AB40C2I0_DIOCR|nr:INO80 complex subunit D-like isoform X1 [Dioscorea cayenensis subsp. rotundata]
MKREPPAEELPGSPRAIHDPESNPGPMEAIAGEDEDEALKMAVVLSREEVLRRRSRRLKQLERCYREQYWALMEELRVRHRDYYWEFGKSPFDGQKGENVVFAAGGEGNEEVAKDGVGGLGFGGGEAGKKGERERCGVSGCKVYAMPLTRFCHSHILLDGKQMLYKGCNYVIKSSAPNGQIYCGKPVLRAAIPSLCPVHFQKAQKHVSQALRKAGLNGPSTVRHAPKFHVILAEYVSQVQAKRRELLNSNGDNNGEKDEKIS